jgi:prepilin-type N-terminal cleavage/methylation domain-containing protein
VDQNEDGLTLVEMMVALMVIGVVLTAMASVLMTAMVSMQRSERVVHSTQLGNEVLEDYLALPYDVLGLYTTEATGHFGGSTFEGEQLVLFPDADSPDARVPEPTRTITRSNVDIEVETAITWIDDPETDSDQDYKRITVLMTWQHRGTTHTARTEATRAPAPDEQPLSVTIEPDLLRLRESPEGAVDGSFTITVIAKEPQSAVEVTWTRRNGSILTPPRGLSSSDTHKMVWSTTITENSDNARFQNGGNLFVIEAQPAASADGKVETTIGRALMLHDLRLDADDLEVTPSLVHVHPDDGPCDGLGVTADIRGALKSDPFSLTFVDDQGDPLEESFPFAADTSLVDGASFELDIDPSDLPVAYGDGEDELRFNLELLRAADPDEPDGTTLTKHVVMEVRDLEVGDSCPA